MRLNAFLQDYPRVLFTAEGDAKFEALRLMTRGHTSPRLAKLINYATGFLDENEYYLEIGTYTGFTLCSAALSRPTRVVGIDNFTESFISGFDVKSELKSNCSRYAQNSTIVESDFRKVDLIEMIKQNFTCGIFFIDGKHTLEDVRESWAWGEPILSKEALVIFDDLNVEGVGEAVEGLRNRGALNEFFRANSFYDSQSSRGMMTDPIIHNGFSLMKYQS